MSEFEIIINTSLITSHMALKKKDFIEIDYTGRLKEDNSVFDTTLEQVAKDEKFNNPETKYSAQIICLGENQIVKGLEDNLVGKELGEYRFEIKTEDAFGKKDAKLIQLVPTKKFLDNKIQPVPGLVLNIDGMIGTVKTVSGGRTVVDFNHPLSGKEVVYNVKINKIVTDVAEKTKAVMEWIGLRESKFEIKDEELTIKTLEDIPKEIKARFETKLKELLNLKKVEFVKA